MKVVLYIIAIYLFYRVFCLLKFTFKRIAAVRKLRKLDGYGGIRVKFPRKPFAHFFKMSKKPDAVFEIGDTVYLARFYNGRGGKAQVHFANEEYSAVFSVLLIRSFFSLSFKVRKGAHAHSTSGVNVKVKILPKLEIPEEYENFELIGKKTVPVLIFNPAPSSVSYVADEKTSIKLAFTGDEFRGIKIFTASSFANFLERETRYFKSDSSEFN